MLQKPIDLQKINKIYELFEGDSTTNHSTTADDTSGLNVWRKTTEYTETNGLSAGQFGEFMKASA